MLKHLKHHWKRTVSGFMALVMAAGLLPGTSLAAETAATPSGVGKHPYYRSDPGDQDRGGL